jgi:hypothetical protein
MRLRNCRWVVGRVERSNSSARWNNLVDPVENLVIQNDLGTSVA